jgi:hypothetical protein
MTKSLLCTAVVSLVAAANAQNPLLVLDQQPDDLNVPHANVADTDTPQYLADGMYVDKCAGAIITSIEIWGGWAGTQPVTDTFTIRFHDTTAILGNNAWQGPLNPPNVTFTQVPILAMTPTNLSIYCYSGSWTVVPEYHIIIQLPQPVTIAKGLSWISLAADGDPNSRFGWTPGFVDPNGHSSQYANYTQPNGSWSPPTVFTTHDFALVVHGVTNGPGQCANNFVANATANVTIEDAPANAPVMLGLSLAGGGPVPSPFGNILLTPPNVALLLLIADPTGRAVQNFSIPGGLTGLNVWFHALELIGPTLTNGAHVVVN